MGKLIIFFLLAGLTQHEIILNHSNSEKDESNSKKDEVSTYEYWSTFSETFEETADYSEAESAALEAESIAKDRTNLKEWLAENKDNLSQVESKTSNPNKC